MRGRPNDELVDVICEHGDEPRLLGRIMPGATLYDPSCVVATGSRVMRAHVTPGTIHVAEHTRRKALPTTPRKR